MQALWMLLAAFLFASMSVCVKFASAYFNSAELVLSRGLIGMALLAWLARSQGVSLATRYPRMHAWRAFIGAAQQQRLGSGASRHCCCRRRWKRRLRVRSDPPVVR